MINGTVKIRKEMMINLDLIDLKLNNDFKFFLPLLLYLNGKQIIYNRLPVCHLFIHDISFVFYVNWEKNTIYESLEIIAQINKNVMTKLQK